MKKFLSIVFVWFIGFSVLSQKDQLYVVLEGGKKSFLPLGRIGYNSYYYAEGSKTDTLKCSGEGMIKCNVDRFYFESGSQDKEVIFNKAIQKAEKHYSREKTPKEDLFFTIKGRDLRIHFLNAMDEAKNEFVITLL